MFEGLLRIAFTGKTGSGLGILVLRNGLVVGADTGGATYDGSYTEIPKTRTVDLVITMSAPAGITPVQTGIPLAAPISVPINASVSQDDIGSENPTLVQTPLGPVNVLLTKIRDFP